MRKKELKNIVGELSSGQPATIRFFGPITLENTSRFNSEFEYLEDYVKPSLIRILINSEGGSVLHGMNTYATIQNSSIPTECINEGLAASMASIIWAGGDRSLMRDYSILMIHNPCLPSQEGDSSSDMVVAFTKQLETIYHKRFGLTKSHVRSIMSGEAGKDGTYFDATSAVKAGIIPAESILKTSRQICDKVKSSLCGLDDIPAIVSLMSDISNEVSIKLFDEKEAIHLVTNNNPTEKMTETTTEYSTIAAQLGLQDKEASAVMSRISELVATESKFKESEKSLSDAKTVIAGKDATISNLQKDLDTTKTSLTEYQSKEIEEKQSKIETMIEAAILAGKLEREKKSQWVSFATSNLDLAEETIASIPAVEKISAEIASDPDNVSTAIAATKSAETKISERVNQVVGEGFEFKKIN